MDPSRRKIQPLPAGVRAMIRTGVALTSIPQAVEELVLNAVDAKATSIAVRIDLSCFKIQVVDNGQGISVDQLPLIGERYSTSKCLSLQDLENLKYFGYRGEALASIRNATSLLEIVTRPKGTCITYSKCFQRGQSLGVSQSSTHRPSHGTTVSAFDLFFNLPVRRNILNSALEIEKIRYRLAGIALMWPKISISLRDDCVGNVILQTQKCSGVLATFSQLFTPARGKGLIEVNIDNDKFRISGLVSKEGYSRKDLQFVFVNKRLVLKSSIHKQVNKIFKRSLILKRRGVNSDEPEKIPQFTHVSNSQPGSPSKQSDQYAIFVLNVECSFKEYDITFDPSKTLVEFRDWPKLIHTLQDMLYGFLRKENLLPPNAYSPSRSDVNFDGFEQMPSSMQLGNDPDQNCKSSGNDFTAHHQFGVRNLESLFSESVCRPGQLASRELMRLEDKGGDRIKTSLLSHAGPDKESSNKLPDSSKYSDGAQSHVYRKVVCFDIDEESSTSRNDFLPKNSNVVSNFSKSHSSNPNVSLNQSEIGEKFISISQPKIKAQGLFDCHPSSSSSATDSSAIEGCVEDEEDPIPCRADGIESEHPLERGNSNITQITLRKGSGYSSSLKNLRDINSFQVQTTPKDISGMMVHTLQDLRMSSRQRTANRNELLKTPEKAIRRKSLEPEQDSSPSKQQRIDLEASSSTYMCSNNVTADNIFQEHQMQTDSSHSVMGQENTYEANGHAVPHVHIQSVSERCETETFNNEKEVVKKQALKKTSHASKLAKRMKGIGKSEDESNRGFPSTQMTRLQSFTYIKEGKHLSDNSCNTSDLLSTELNLTGKCNVESANGRVPEQKLQMSPDHISHCAPSCVTLTIDNNETQNIAEINDLPFSMYSANKEMHVNTPKLSVVLSIPIIAEQYNEQQSCVKDSINLASNVKAFSQSPNRDLHQSIHLAIESDKVNEEPSNTTDRHAEEQFGEKAFERSVDSDQEDCSSEISQGFHLRSDDKPSSSHSLEDSLHCVDDAQKQYMSQGFTIKSHSTESSLGCGETEMSIPCHHEDISPSNANLEDKQSETSEQSSSKMGELRLNVHCQKKVSESNLEDKDSSLIFEKIEANDPESFTYHQERLKGEKKECSLLQTTTNDLNDVNTSANSFCPSNNRNAILECSPSEKSVISNEKEDVQSLDENSVSNKSARKKSGNSDISFSAHEYHCQWTNMNVESDFFRNSKASKSNENIVTNNLEESRAVGIDSDSSSSIPCGQEERKMNIESCSSESLEQRQNLTEENNCGSTSSLLCAQSNSMPKRIDFGNSDSMSLPMTNILSHNIVAEADHSDVEPSIDTLIGSKYEQGLTGAIMNNPSDFHTPDEFQGASKVQGGDNQQQESDSHKNECMTNSFRIEKNKLISVCPVMKETALDAFKSTSGLLVQNTPSLGPIQETDCNKSPAKVISPEKTDCSLGMRRNTDIETAFPVINSENVPPTTAVNVDIDQESTDEISSTHWCCVTQPSTGTHVYINNKSGHSISEEEWSKLAPHEQDGLLADISQNPVPQESTDFSDARKHDTDGENSDVFSKWREDKEPIYDADKGGDVASVISEWTDTVFLKYKLPTELFLCDALEKNSNGSSRSLSQVEFKKEMLQCVEVLGQVDNKFLACTIMEKATTSKKDNSSSVITPMLVFFDQHAVHERVRLESLTTEVYESSEACHKERIKREKIVPPLTLQLNRDDVRVMKAFAEEFDRIGVEFAVDCRSRDRIVVTSVPLCMTESKRIKGALKQKIEELISEHIDLLKTTNGTCGKLPLAIHRVLCSQACRGAIKFGDPLSKSECEELLLDLSTCKLPFQCAHGRPSIAPLVSLLDLEMEFKDSVKRPRLQNITRLMKASKGDNEKA